VEKRSILFIVLSVLIMGGWMLLNAYLAPPPPPVEEVVQETPADDPAGQPGDTPAENPSDEPPGPDRDDPKTLVEAPGEELLPGEQDPATLPTKVVSLGSLDPDSGYRMLATFSTEGASLKRLELNDPQFKDVDVDQGYLGHLELKPAPGGLEVQVNLAGSGTPAEKAGIQQGDLIARFGTTQLDVVADFDAALAETEPGDVVELLVQKPDGSKNQLTVTLIRSPQQLIQPNTGLPVRATEEESTVPRNPHPYSFRLTLSKPPQPHQDATAYIDSLLSANWVLTSSDNDQVVFERTLNRREALEIGLIGEWRIIKRFRLAKADLTLSGDDAATDRKKAAQHITWEFEIHNDSDQEQPICYWIEGPTGMPVEGWWYSYKIHPKMFYTAGARDVVLDSEGLGYKVWGARNIFKDTYAKPERNLLFVAGDPHDTRKLDFIGVDTQYFATLLIPGTVDTLTTQDFRRGQAMTWDEAEKKDLAWAKATDVSFNLQSEIIHVAPSEAAKQSYVIFAGPKEPDLVALYGADETIYYGWFGMVSKPLLAVLHMLSFLGYGLAIILLTLMVRACLWPLSRKAARNAQMMQVIKPELDAIRTKYKNDMEKQGQAQREIMAKYKVNPFGGCLLMFFQMPVFLGLYRGLSVDLQLRDQPLIPGLPWAENLAAPDRLFYWGTSPAFLFSETGWLGPYLNILPLVTVGLFIAQQKLFMPPATDDQTKAQQKMMNYMMVFMGLMFFKVPSGLCLYFITTSLFSIIERLLLPPAKPSEVSVAKAPGKPSDDKPTSAWSQLMNGKPKPVDPKQQRLEKKQREKRRKGAK